MFIEIKPPTVFELPSGSLGEPSCPPGVVAISHRTAATKYVDLVMGNYQRGDVVSCAQKEYGFVDPPELLLLTDPKICIIEKNVVKVVGVMCRFSVEAPKTRPILSTTTRVPPTRSSSPTPMPTTTLIPKPTERPVDQVISSIKKESYKATTVDYIIGICGSSFVVGIFTFLAIFPWLAERSGVITVDEKAWDRAQTAKDLEEELKKIANKWLEKPTSKLPPTRGDQINVKFPTSDKEFEERQQQYRDEQKAEENADFVSAVIASRRVPAQMKVEKVNGDTTVLQGRYYPSNPGTSMAILEEEVQNDIAMATASGQVNITVKTPKKQGGPTIITIILRRLRRG